MELKFAFVGLLLLSLGGVEQAKSKEITHEDIKEAMLRLVHIMRDNTEKLERHEARDRQTAEQLKKAISLLTKRMSGIDDLKAYLVKVDERVAGLEQLINEKGSSELAQMQKSTNALEDLETRLEGWAMMIGAKMMELAQTARPPDMIAKLNETENRLGERLDKLHELQNIKEEIKTIYESLNKLEKEKPVAESTSNITDLILENQNRSISHVEDMLENTLKIVRDLPRQSAFTNVEAATMDVLFGMKHEMKEGLKIIHSWISESDGETRNSVSSLRDSVSEIAVRLDHELNDLDKGQAVMVEMANHVLDTKKRLEHAYMILREMGDLVTLQGLNINHTLNTRFDGISNDIMDNQNGALANLTAKMDEEMNRVWRQINIMYKEMMESAKALDKLHKQNEAYVNGTTTTMDGMESKVGEITKRMGEVDTNLNFLLGRLSLVTQEFNLIKEGLGAALDNIKASFKEVQARANDLSGNPGPHPVPEGYTEIDSSSAPEVASSQSPSDANLNF